MANETLFVRGKYQLAKYEPGSPATGHRLTEREFNAAFGDEKLHEIDECQSAVLLTRPGAIGHALRKQRTDLRVSQGQLARAAGVNAEVVKSAESDADPLTLRQLEDLAFVLGLDPIKLSVDERAGADQALGVRLRVLESPSAASTGPRLTPQAVLRFSEATSIIRSQLLLQHWLGKPQGAEWFTPSPNYSSPAFRIGYELAGDARERLGLETKPVDSMRDLVERRLGIPIVQVELPNEIAGATISSQGQRGIVLNIKGRNSNVWVRRATLAHELAHILFDPGEQLKNLRVDRYDELERNAERGPELPDFVEQRANAFAIEFLAPSEAIKSLIPSAGQVSAKSIADVMSVFGIGQAAALYHVGNAWFGQAELPSRLAKVEPAADQQAAEDLTLDYFEPSVTPPQRRGRFATLVAEAVDAGLITRDTAAQYLACSVDELGEALTFLRDLAN